MIETSNRLFSEEMQEGVKEEMQEIINYSEKNKMTGNEIRMAYLIAMEVAEKEDIKNIREEVFALAKIMDESSKKGTPLNYITGMIGDKYYDEKYPKSLEEVIRLSNLSEEEKKILDVVLDRESIGVMHIKDDKGKELLAIDTFGYIDDDEMSDEDVAEELTELLYRAMTHWSKNGKIKLSYNEGESLYDEEDFDDDELE